MRKSQLLLIFLTSVQLMNSQIINIPSDEPTIQAGIESASNGDTILVQSGTYTENINFMGKEIIIASLFLTTNDTSYISQTIIDGNQNGSVVTFNSDENSQSVLTGFTIRNGSGYDLFGGPDTEGGGILIDNASPSLSNLSIQGNSAQGSGGGIFLHNSSSTIEDVEIIGNMANSAAGVYCVNDFNTNLEMAPRPSIHGSRIAENEATFRGGGVYFGYTLVILSEVVISGNSATNGGAMYVGNSKTILNRTTISQNSASAEGGVLFLDGGEAIIVNSIVTNNSPQSIYKNPDPAVSIATVAYSNIEGGEAIFSNMAGIENWEEGNIDSDPMFFDQENYYLTTGSPCIDSGTSFYIFDLDTIVNLLPSDYLGMSPEMGAHELDIASNLSEWELDNFFELQIHPNPSSQFLHLTYLLREPSEMTTFIYDVNGRLVKEVASKGQEESGKNEMLIPIENVQSGNYIVVLRSDSNISKSLIIVD